MKNMVRKFATDYLINQEDLPLLFNQLNMN